MTSKDMEWLRQSWLDTLALTADWMRSSDFIEDMEGREEMYGYCTNSFLGGRPVTTHYELQPCQADGVTGQECLQVGDTVRITGNEFAGQVGEITVIDQGFGEDADFYGVYLDSIEKEEFFWADELERVENVDRAELPF